MREIIAINHVTLDGVVQGPGGVDEDPSNGFSQGGWAMGYEEQAVGRALAELMAGEFELLLGRLTYQIWAAYWPEHNDHDIGRAFNSARKYIATNTLAELDWENSQPLSGDVAGRLRQLKQEAGPPMHIWGSGNLLQSLTAAGLVDEYRLWTYPLVLGQGKRLFEQGLPRRGLQLVDSTGTPSGIVISTYRLAE